jgi:molybdate transport system ATP-binding protein
LLDISISRQLRDYKLSVDLKVKTGEYLILTGNNGAGKSTILNIVAGLMTPEQGYIRVNGTSLFDAGRGIDVPPEKRRIGYVFQNSAVFPHLTVSENIAYGLRAMGMGKHLREKKVTGLIEQLKLDHLRSIRAEQLSGGQKQLVALGRAIAIDPVLLLLDEPYRALDVVTCGIVKNCIQDMVRSLNIPCILVTHQVSDRDLTNGRMCRIHQGAIVEPDS